VLVAGVYPHAYPAPAYEEDQSVRVWRIQEPSTRFGWVTARMQLYRLIRSWVRARECELVECPDCYGWIAGWPKLPVPLVLRAHGSLTFYAHELQQHVDPIGHRLEAWAYRRANAWVAVSRHTADLTTKLFNLKSGPNAILYNPVDIPSEVPPFKSRHPGKVVFTGTLTRKKGINALFDAWPMVKERYADAELHVYGKDGGAENGDSMQNYLLNRSPEALHNSIEFHGHVRRENLIQALGTARVAVFPSYTETFGLGPVEAMACACPTIYTKLTCGPEIVNDGVDGILIDPDQPREISQSILAVVMDDMLAQRLSAAGRERALRSYTLAHLLPANETFFAGVINSFNGRESRPEQGGITHCPA